MGVGLVVSSAKERREGVGVGVAEIDMSIPTQDQDRLSNTTSILSSPKSNQPSHAIEPPLYHHIVEPTRRAALVFWDS